MKQQVLFITWIVGAMAFCGASAFAADAKVAMTISIHRTSDGKPEPDNKIHWNSVSLPVKGGWILADDYIQLDSTMSPDTALTQFPGIQIYTDNRASDANPKYMGVISSNTQTPAGLVDMANRVKRLPMAWSIHWPLTPYPIAANPNDNGQVNPVTGKTNPTDPNAFQWLFFEDKSQVAVPSQNASAFSNGDTYITVENLSCFEGGGNRPCIHWGQDAGQFKLVTSPAFIFLEADFGAAVTPATFQTSTLRLESYSQ